VNDFSHYHAYYKILKPKYARFCSGESLSPSILETLFQNLNPASSETKISSEITCGNVNTRGQDA